MNAPVTLASLAADRIWVAWQTEDRADGKPPTKVPVCTGHRSPRARRRSAHLGHTRAGRSVRGDPADALQDRRCRY